MVFVLCVVAAPLTANDQCSDGPDFRFDPDKSLVFKPNPERVDASPRSSLSADGKLRAETEYRNVRVFSVADNKALYEFATPNYAKAPVFSPLRSIAFADHGNLSSASDIDIRELESGEQSKIGDCLGGVMWLDFSGDGKRLAYVSIYGPFPGMFAKARFGKELGGEVTVYDISNRKTLLTVGYILPERLTPNNAKKVFPYLPTRIALDRDGSTLLIASNSGLIRVIDVNTGVVTISTEIKMPVEPKE